MSKASDLYLSDNYLVLDMEVQVEDGEYGSARDPRNQLVYAGWETTGRRGGQFGNELEQPALLEHVAKADFLVCHNAAYELGWLKRMGVDLASVVVFDTQLAEYVLSGNLASVDDKTGLAPLALNLDACARRRGLTIKDAIVDIWLKNGIRINDMPRQWVASRCRKDVADTHQLFLSQRESLRRSNRLPVLWTRCVLTPALVDVEGSGMHLDPPRVDRAVTDTEASLAELTTELATLTGGINWRSSKQVGEYLYKTLGFAELTDRRGNPKRTADDKPKTDAKTLAALVATTPEQKQFLDLKKRATKLSSALSKNLNYFKYACDTNDGLMYARFNQSVTATHRLSSSGVPTPAGSVQFQNMPRAFKPLMNARTPNWLMMEIDGSQLEFRVAAFLGDDQQARKDILDPGWDAHIVTASVMFQIPYDELYARYKAGDKKAEAMRQLAKPETFKPLYGGNRGSAAQERWYAGFRKRYADLAAVQSAWVGEVVGNKRLITPWGMRYYWPKARVNNEGYCNVTASVYNYPVQALATAEIIPIALVAFWRATRQLRDAGLLHIVNTVHDSVVVEVDPSVVEQVREIALDSFTLKVYDYLRKEYNIEFDVPLGCGIKVGTHWGEGTESSYNVFNDGRRVQIK